MEGAADRKTGNTVKTISYSLKFLLKNDKMYLCLKMLNLIPSVLGNVAAVMLPKYIIDSLSEEQSVESALLYTLYLMGILILNSLFHELLRKELSVRSMQLNNTMKKELLKTISVMDYDRLEDAQTLDKFEYAKVCLEEAGITSISDILFGMVSGLLSLGAYFYIVIRYSCFFVPLVVLSVILHMFSQGRKESMYIHVQEESAALNRKIQYASHNLTDYSFAKEIRLFKLKDFIVEKYDTFMGKMYGLEYRYLKKTIPLHLLVSGVGALQILIAYGVVGYSLYQGDITVGVFIQYTSTFFAMNTTVASIAASFVNLNTKWTYISSYEEFLEKGRKAQKGEKGPASSDAVKSFHCLELKNVSFRYPDSEEDVIHDLNLTIHANEKIAVVGANGAGKTTLIKLILGFYKPAEGEILLDGVPFQSMDFEEKIQYFSAVFQDFGLLHYSVAENIALDEQYSAEQIQKILEQLHLDKKMESLKNGMDTCVTRNLDAEGADMSGGEKQKLMIARALYKEAPVYIFDEPTSALSPTGEYEIYRSFSRITENKTVLYISHRLACCRLCSRILVVKDGTVVEDGCFEKLMEKKGDFAAMYEAQADYYRYEVSS